MVHLFTYTICPFILQNKNTEQQQGEKNYQPRMDWLRKIDVCLFIFCFVMYIIMFELF